MPTGTILTRSQASASGSLTPSEQLNTHSVVSDRSASEPPFSSESSHNASHGSAPAHPLHSIDTDVRPSTVSSSSSSAPSLASFVHAEPSRSPCYAYFEELVEAGFSLRDPCDCGRKVMSHPRRPAASVPIEQVAQVAAVAPSSLSASSVIAPSLQIPSELVKNLPNWKEFTRTDPFFERIQLEASFYNLSTVVLPRLLLKCTSDLAQARWIDENIVRPSLSWEQAKLAFKSHFGQSDLKQSAEQAFFDCKQRKNESIQQYYERFIDISSRVSFDERTIVSRFIVGLSDPLRSLWQSFQQQQRIIDPLREIELTSMRQACDTLLQFEASLPSNQSSGSHDRTTSAHVGVKKEPSCQFHPHINSHTTQECRANPENSHSHSSSSNQKHASGSAAPAAASSSSDRDHRSSNMRRSGPIVCFRCDQPGHKSPACPNKPKTTPQPPNNPNQSGGTKSSGTSFVQNRPSASADTNVTISTRAVTVDTDAPSPTNGNGEGVSSRVSLVVPLDRSLPASILVPTRKRVMFQIDNQLFGTLVDSGAEVSCVDKSVVKELNLPIDAASATGVLQMADSELRVPRLGRVTIPFTAFFPSSDLPPCHLSHSFEIMSLSSPESRTDYQFLIGADLLPTFFGGSVPIQFLSTAPAVTKRQQFPAVEAVCVVSAHAADGLYSPAPSAVLETSSLDQLSSHVSLGKSIRSLESSGVNSACDGYGQIPLEELPDKWSLSTDPSLDVDHSVRRNHLLSELADVLRVNEQITGFCNLPDSVVRLEVDPDKVNRLYRSQYKVAQTLHDLADAVIRRWFDEGKICYSPPNCPFNNPITIAPKKDDDGKLTGIRVCLDTRALNDALIVNDRFPIPNIRDVLETFASNRLFGEFDLSEAYLQFELHPDSRPYTAFTWNRMQYMFVGCPFGISLLPSYFQRIMSYVFRDMPFTFPYFDNIPIASPDWNTHAEHARLIVHRLNQVNLRIKPSSVNIGHSQIKCLGHILSVDGIGMDPAKLQSIRDWPRPNTSAELQSFLGFAGFIRQHVRHFAELTAPLEAIKFQKTIDWNDSLIEHFEATKAAVLTSPFLQFPDFSRPFHLATDASNTGVGGVLYQPLHSEEQITPRNIVAICSKKLKDHQTRYPAYKKELLGIVYCLRKFHSYIWGRDDLIVVTDHKPLTYILSSPQLSTALQQWLDVILDYSFKIRHRDGVLHVVPDQLSRIYSAHYSTAASWGCPPRGSASLSAASAPASSDVVGDSIPPIDVRLVSVPTSSPAISSSAAEGDAATSASVSKPSSALTEREELLIATAKRGKVCPPDESVRRQLIVDAHQFGHFGIQAMFDNIWHKGFWWPDIRKDIQDEIRHCDACSRFTVTKSGFHPFSYITASGPGEHMQIDTCVHLPPTKGGYKALLVAIDVFTGFVILRPLKKTTAAEVARELWEIWCILGPPRILQSDNGPEYVNEVLAALVKVTGIEHRFISPYNPRADGKVERAIGSVMMIIKKLLHGCDENWALFAPFAQLSFNNKVASLTGSTPFALMFGRPMNELKDHTVNNNGPKPISLDDWKVHQEKILSLIYPAISDRIHTQKDKMVRTLNSHRRRLIISSLPTGAQVMLRDPIRKNKFEPKYVGPYTIARRSRNGAYVLRDATGDILDRHVPVDQLKLISKFPLRTDRDNVYVVDRIIAHRGTPGNYEYLITWKGYDDITWEPESHILDAASVKTYWNSNNKHTHNTVSFTDIPTSVQDPN